MRCIILTKAQADAIRAAKGSDTGHALDPIEKDDGNFVLPERVLTDPHHAALVPTLSTRTKQEVTDADFTQVRARL